MATKVYITSQAINTNLVVPSAVETAAFAAGWEGVMAGGTVFHMEGWANVTGAVARPNSANVNKLIKSGANTSIQERYGLRVYFGPLTAGETITGSQAIEAGIMGAHGATFGFHWLLVALRVLSNTGTVRKEMCPADTSAGTIYDSASSFPATTYSSRHDAGTSAATNYVTVAGDWLVAEFGSHYETASSLDLSFKTGDGNGTDIDLTDSTTLRNPYFMLTSNHTLTPAGGSKLLMLTGCGV